MAENDIEEEERLPAETAGDDDEELLPPMEGMKDGGEDEELYEHKKITADKGQSLIRVDQFLSILLKNTSRTRVKNATLSGCVRVNNKVVKASYKVKPGDEVSVLLPYPPPPEVQPENIPLNIIYEDDDLLLLDKRPGMVCHPGVGHWDGTMIHALLYHFNVKGNRTGKDMITPHLVHRIDKDTSGILIVAKNGFAHAHLSKQFFERSTDRLYYALVWGDVKQDRGVVVGHVGRSLWNRKKFFVYADGSHGKHAVTHYSVVERFGFATLVQCKLETGRTHQIRVHMKFLKHTLFADSFYGGDEFIIKQNTPGYYQFMQNCLQHLNRQALHAKTLGFEHPTQGKRLFFDSPLPIDFTSTLEKMRSYVKNYG
jgi:23S rRNA pseudouridine1911/1915/1917 synthase